MQSRTDGIYLPDAVTGRPIFYHEDVIRFEIRYQLHKLRCMGCSTCCGWCAAVADGRSKRCDEHDRRRA